MKRFFAVLFAAAALVGCSEDNDTQQYDYLTFEDVEAKFTAGPTPAGENLMDGYADQYTGYSDAATGLSMTINESYGACNFWNGGIAISQWNVMTNDGFNTADENQCSVYYEAANGYGGHNCSKTFAVVYYATYDNSDAPALYFEDGQTERVFDHFWVTNSTYAALAMKDGSSYNKALNYTDKDWFLLTINGYDKSGAKTGVVRFYLADFRTTQSGGIVKKWTKVDLSTLGSVNSIEFVLTGSDSDVVYGLNTPTYFCFDDVAIRR